LDKIASIKKIVLILKIATSFSHIEKYAAYMHSAEYWGEKKIRTHEEISETCMQFIYTCFLSKCIILSTDKH